MYDVIYKKNKRKKKSKQFWRRKIIAKSTIIVCSKLANSPLHLQGYRTRRKRSLIKTVLTAKDVL